MSFAGEVNLRETSRRVLSIVQCRTDAHRPCRLPLFGRLVRYRRRIENSVGARASDRCEAMQSGGSLSFVQAECWRHRTHRLPGVCMGSSLLLYTLSVQTRSHWPMGMIFLNINSSDYGADPVSGLSLAKMYNAFVHVDDSTLEY